MSVPRLRITQDPDPHPPLGSHGVALSCLSRLYVVQIPVCQSTFTTPLLVFLFVNINLIHHYHDYRSSLDGRHALSVNSLRGDCSVVMLTYCLFHTSNTTDTQVQLRINPYTSLPFRLKHQATHQSRHQPSQENQSKLQFAHLKPTIVTATVQSISQHKFARHMPGIITNRQHTTRRPLIYTSPSLQ